MQRDRRRFEGTTSRRRRGGACDGAPPFTRGADAMSDFDDNGTSPVLSQHVPVGDTKSGRRSKGSRLTTSAALALLHLKLKMVEGRPPMCLCRACRDSAAGGDVDDEK